MTLAPPTAGQPRPALARPRSSVFASVALAAAPLLSSTAILATPAAALAQERSGPADDIAEDAGARADLVTDRPDVTESTSIVAPRWVQAELGLSHEDAAGSTLAAPGTLVRIGVSPRVEVRLGWSGWIDEDPDDCPAGGEGVPSGCGAAGASDGEAGVKVLLVERSGARPDVGVITAVTVPIGDEAFTSDGFDPSLTLLLGNDLSTAVAWGANAGVAFVSPGHDVDDDRTSLVFWSWSFGFGMTDRLGSFLEYFGQAPEGDPAVHALDTGFTFLVTPDLQVDASAGVGLGDRAPDLFVGAGLAYRLRVF